MTKHKYLLQVLDHALTIERAVSNYHGAERMYRKGQIYHWEMRRLQRRCMTVGLRHGRPNKMVKRFTPPFPASYWAYKAGYTTQGLKDIHHDWVNRRTCYELATTT